MPQQKNPGQDFYKGYYNNYWAKTGAHETPMDEKRARATLELIPGDVSSILDVGCGSGLLTNRLASKYPKVVGLDTSPEALRHVKAESKLGSAENLPFPDTSFDLVITSEVLEHLPYHTYPLALSEIERVSAKYILIAVPHSEDLEKRFATCPECFCRFHKWRHVRSYTRETLNGLFNNFSPLVIKTCMATNNNKQSTPGQPAEFPPGAVCPQCGYTREASEAEQQATANHDDEEMYNHCGWLMALYQQKY